ncbi:unnamed protein product [Lactuca virosa]|uniref:Annexin n=1 Tax=Lactuca virosa TaxID=75947 RepID=A0AAU9N894_9ASTR|nr:unnamed protein product [Lactuca virosa]
MVIEILLWEERWIYHTKEEQAKQDADLLHHVLTNDHGPDGMHVAAMIAREPIAHLQSVLKHFKTKSGGISIYDHVEMLQKHKLLRVIFQCLLDPISYFTEVLDTSLKDKEHDFHDKDALMRVIVTRAGRDLKLIKEAYFTRKGKKLIDVIGDSTKGHYKHFVSDLFRRLEVDEKEKEREEKRKKKKEEKKEEKEEKKKKKREEEKEEEEEKKKREREEEKKKKKEGGEEEEEEEGEEEGGGGEDEG